MAVTRAWLWWKRAARRAGAVQARALLFVTYYTLVAPFALLARWRKPDRGSAGHGWLPHPDDAAPPLERLRKQS